jgi:hypothetical protein
MSRTNPARSISTGPPRVRDDGVLAGLDDGVGVGRGVGRECAHPTGDSRAYWTVEIVERQNKGETGYP